MSRFLAGKDHPLSPLVEVGILEPLDLQVVHVLGNRAGEEDPQVLLGCALAVRSPRRGHVGTALDGAFEDLVPEVPGTPRAPLPEFDWPRDRQAWIDLLVASPMVGDGSGHHPFVWANGLLTSHRYHTHQAQLAQGLLARSTKTVALADPVLFRVGVSALFPAAAAGLDRQALGAIITCLRRLAVVSGGPGMGKTWSIRRALALMWVQHALRQKSDPGLGPLRIALAAPTGKASARVRESLHTDLPAFVQEAKPALGGVLTPEQLQAHLESLEATTIHRLLGVRPDHNSRYRHHRDRPLAVDVVLVDEASMVDLALMARLEEAVPEEASLVLMGDRHQLASVEAGSVLADLCGPVGTGPVRLSASARELVTGATGWAAASMELAPGPGPQDAIVQLDRNHRFSDDSAVGRFAAACLATPFQVDAAVDPLLEGIDVQWIPAEPDQPLPGAFRDCVVSGYGAMLQCLNEGPGPGESGASHQARVLEAFEGFRVLCAHRRGRRGVAGLNRQIEAWLSSADRPLTARLRSTGAHARGRPVLVLRNDSGLGRFNGDVGVTLSPDQVVFRGRDGLDLHAPQKLPEHQPAWSMTIHKSQGSEFQRVVVVLPERDSPLLTRELIYTAVTRSSGSVVLVGSEAVLRQGLKRPVRRASGLGPVLWGNSVG